MTEEGKLYKQLYMRFESVVKKKPYYKETWYRGQPCVLCT